MELLNSMGKTGLEYVKITGHDDISGFVNNRNSKPSPALNRLSAPATNVIILNLRLGRGIPLSVSSEAIMLMLSMTTINPLRLALSHRPDLTVLLHLHNELALTRPLSTFDTEPATPARSLKRTFSWTRLPNGAKQPTGWIPKHARERDKKKPKLSIQNTDILDSLVQTGSRWTRLQHQQIIQQICRKWGRPHSDLSKVRTIVIFCLDVSTISTSSTILPSRPFKEFHLPRRNQSVNFLLDTGANINVICTALRLQLPTSPSATHQVGRVGGKTDVFGKVLIEAQFNKSSGAELYFHVMSEISELPYLDRRPPLSPCQSKLPTDNLKDHLPAAVIEWRS